MLPSSPGEGWTGTDQRPRRDFCEDSLAYSSAFSNSFAVKALDGEATKEFFRYEKNAHGATGNEHGRILRISHLFLPFAPFQEVVQGIQAALVPSLTLNTARAYWGVWRGKQMACMLFRLHSSSSYDLRAGGACALF
jgi:hypothetical protein